MFTGNGWLLKVCAYLLAFSASLSSPKNVPSIMSTVGGKVAIPCNISIPADDSVVLILWYKGDTTGAPIYSVDARYTESLVTAEHFQSKGLENRAVFDTSWRPASLVIDPVKPEDDGHYFCRMDFKWSRTVIVPIFLNVYVPPHQLIITNENGVQFRNTAGPFNEGEEAVLHCLVKGGKPPPAVHWLQNDGLIDDSFEISENGSYVINTLTIAHLERSDLHSRLTCQVGNNYFSTSSLQNTVTVEMNLKPLSLRIVTPQKVLFADQRQEIVCQTQGSRPPAQISWTLNGKLLPYARETYAGEGNISTSVLEIIPRPEDNGSSLVCRAENPRLSNSSQEDSWILNIFYKPLVQLMVPSASQKRKLISVKEESGLSLNCVINANPETTTMLWFFNEEPLQFGSTQEGSMVVTNRSLKVERINRNHEGSYKCAASNSEGTSQSDTLRVDVHFTPICRSNQTTHTVAIGASLTIFCQVSAKPNKVTFRWTLAGGKGVGGGGGGGEERDLDNRSVSIMQEDDEASELTIVPKTMNDFGTYYCRAMNSVGWQKEPCQFRVEPKGPPKALHSCTITNKTNSTIYVKCLHDEDESVTEFFVLEIYDTLQKKLVAKIEEKNGPRFQVNGLQSNTSYVLVMYTVNEKGRSNNAILTVITESLASRSDSLETSDSERPTSSPIHPFFSALSVILITATCILSLLVIIILKITYQMRSSRRRARNQTNQAKHQETPESRTEAITPDLIPFSVEIPGSIIGKIFEETRVALVEESSGAWDTAKLLNGPSQIGNPLNVPNGLLNLSESLNEASVSGLASLEKSMTKDERFAQNFRSTPV